MTLISFLKNKIDVTNYHCQFDVDNKWKTGVMAYLKRTKKFTLRLRKYVTPRKYHIAKDTLKGELQSIKKDSKKL